MSAITLVVIGSLPCCDGGAESDLWLRLGGRPRGTFRFELENLDHIDWATEPLCHERGLLSAVQLNGDHD